MIAVSIRQLGVRRLRLAISHQLNSDMAQNDTSFDSIAQYVPLGLLSVLSTETTEHLHIFWTAFDKNKS